MLWRRNTAAVVHGQFPANLDYPTARPALLLGDAGLDVHILDMGVDRPGRSYPGCTLWVEPSRWGIAQRLLRLRPEVTFLEGATWMLGLLPLSRRSWVRYTGPGGTKFRRTAQQWLMPRASAVGFQNPYERSQFRIDPSRRADLPGPVDLKFWSTRVAKDPGFWTHRGLSAPHGPLLAYVAQITPGKRQAQLVEMLAPLMNERVDLRLVLAGYVADEREAAALRSASKRLGISDRVIEIGNLTGDEMKQLYAWTSVHVINSEREMQCMALYESLAAGVPTMISDIPELTSAFPGLLHHARGEQLRANVVKLLDSPGTAAAQVDEAQEQLQWADIAAHDEVFERTLKRLLR